MNLRNASLWVAMVAMAAANLTAADIQLSGIVVDETNTPLAGAKVALEGLATATISGADGRFLLTGSTSDLSGVRSALRPKAFGLVVGSGAVRLVGAPDGSTWTLDALRSDGRVLASQIPFRDQIATLPTRLADRLILRLRQNGKVVSTWKSTPSAYREAAAGAWNLYTTKPGYAPGKQSLATLTQSQLLDTLVGSAPWIPSGALLHQGPQVKILAKGTHFAMGSNLVDEALTSGEGHRHRVDFGYDFWIDTTEVTQKAYQEVMSDHYGLDFQATPTSPATGVGDQYPIYSIFDDATWGAGGAILYANALSALQGLDSVYAYSGRDGVGPSAVLEGVVADPTRNGYRLPTEAEWEYAARGGTTTDTYWGQEYATTLASADSANLSAHAVWAGNAFANGIENPGYGVQPVASKPANAYGLYDMIGNLSEWCHEAWTDGYAAGRETDPLGLAPTTLEPWHAIRGGDWGGSFLYQRAANRSFAPPAYAFYFVGFRTVRSAP